jgi:regulator of sigma E protease
MTTFLGSLWWLLVSLGILVTFHEFGHFWVARRMGVKVIRFSVGFGRALWSRTGKDGTQYQIAALPLGGYVQMLDERETEVSPADRPFAFNNKPLWQRFLVVLAGPMANLVLCICLLWLMFMIGLPDRKPTLGHTQGLAAEAGLREGDTLVSVAGQPTPTLTQAITPLVLAAMDRQSISVIVRTPAGETVEHILRLERLPAQFNQEDSLDVMGLTASSGQFPPVVDGVTPNTGADGVLKPGDRIQAVAGTAIEHFSDIGPALQTATKIGGVVHLRVLRDGKTLDLSVLPTRSNDDGPSRWILGIDNQKQAALIRERETTYLRYGPVDAGKAALAQTAQMTRNMFGILLRLFNGKASLKNLSGVVGIAQAANESAGLGAAWFLNLLATLSLSLCIMNLLPIPVLDGGHLLYYLIELVSGRPVSERLLMAGQYAGLALLAGLMGLAFYNDIFRLVS